METQTRTLMQQVRDKKTEIAQTALEALRRLGGLQDGSLAGAAWYGAHLAGVDLRGAKLSGAILSGVDLRGADLQGADLSGADMIDANLSGANLSNAVLRGADLIAAKFSGADLTHCDLSEAALGGARFNYAIFHHSRVEGSNFNHAICDHSIFADVELSAAKDLETIRHFGPSEVGIQTLVQSMGRVPAVFWRGCGLSEAVIAGGAGFLAQADEYAACFISYSYPERFFARELQAQLAAAGVRCWLDEHQIRRRVDFYEVLNRAARLRHRVVVCCSQAALNSWWFQEEVEMALQHEEAEQRSILLPVAVDGALAGAGDASGFLQKVAQKLVADFAGTKGQTELFAAEISKILRELRRV